LAAGSGSGATTAAVLCSGAATGGSVANSHAPSATTANNFVLIDMMTRTRFSPER